MGDSHTLADVPLEAAGSQKQPWDRSLGPLPSNALPSGAVSDHLFLFNAFLLLCDPGCSNGLNLRHPLSLPYLARVL